MTSLSYFKLNVEFLTFVHAHAVSAEEVNRALVSLVVVLKTQVVMPGCQGDDDVDLDLDLHHEVAFSVVTSHVVEALALVDLDLEVGVTHSWH